MPETLEFEEPIAILNKEIEALGMLPQTDVRDGEIEGLAVASTRFAPRSTSG
jgi:hypothetical protein